MGIRGFFYVCDIVLWYIFYCYGFEGNENNIIFFQLGNYLFSFCLVI